MPALLFGDDPLSEFRWKNRILLVSAPLDTLTGEELQALRKALTSEAKPLRERDLIVIDLSQRPLNLPNAKRLSQAKSDSLSRKLKLSEATGPVFLLLGKDGGEKARQSPQLDLAKLFALIDTMPMRRSEMKRQQPAPLPKP